MSRIKLAGEADQPKTEFTRFKKQLEFDKVSLPTLPMVEKKHRELRELDSRILTQDEVHVMIQKRNRDKVDNVNIVLKRGRLRAARETAVANDDEPEILRIDKELQDLEDRHGKKITRESQMERLAKLNAENRKRNITEIRRAEIEEKKAARAATLVNPFMRVKTVAKTRHVTEGTKKEEDPVAQNGDEAPRGNGQAKDQSPFSGGILGPATKGRRMGGVDDVIANYDFGIEIDI